MTLKPGTLLKERYRILSILGQGGMGAVYRARDEVLSVSVAVKENLFLAEEYTRQFQQEATILASLRHPNLPRVGDYCSISGQGQYLIMDYIEGEDLRQRIARLKMLPENEVILIGVIICQALSYLHSRKPPIIHRDIKPGNIKITPEGDVFLVDFGLAKIAEDPHQATITGARAMTPGYSPPEQYGTARTDARTDIYSLGATLYAALTGEVPEDGLARITGKQSLTSLLSLRPNMNMRLAEVIERALAVDADERYQTAEEFKNALIEAGELGHLFKEKPTITPPPMKAIKVNGYVEEKIDNGLFEVNPLGERKSSNQFKRPWLMALLLLLVLIIGGLGIWGTGFPPGKQLGGLSVKTMEKTATIGQTETVSIIKTNTKTYTQTSTETATIPQSESIVSDTPQPVKPSSTPKPTSSATIPIENTEPATIMDSFIAFVSDRSGNVQVWTMLSDGSDQRQVTNMDGGACQPSISPDGKRIVFISPCKYKQEIYEGAQLYIVNTDGMDLSLVPVPFSPEGDFDPAWSPSGNQIAFTSLRSGVLHIFVFDLENLTLHELSNTLYADRYPAWSPDGKQLAYSHIKLNSVIWIMSANGDNQTPYTRSGNVNNFTPAWSSDGSLIIYSQMDAEKGGYPNLAGLYYKDMGSSKEFRILPKGVDVTYPVASASFSPDGKWIVFESWPDGRNHDIYLMDIEGSNLTRITTDPGLDIDPSWSRMFP